MKKRLEHFLRNAATESLPVAARVGTETLVLTFGWPPVLASGAGEIVERVTESVTQKLRRPDVDFDFSPVVAVAPIPEEAGVSPGFFLYTLKTVPFGHRSLQTDEIAQVYPHYLADGRIAQWIGQRLAGTHGTLEILETLDEGSTAQIAWSLWVDRRAQTPFFDDWCYRESTYHIGVVAAGSATGYYLWNRGVTTNGFAYYVWTGDRLHESDPPRIWTTPQALEDDVRRNVGDIRINPVIGAPEVLRRQLVVTAVLGEPVPHVVRQASAAPMVHVSRPIPVQHWTPNGAMLPELHAKFYAAGFRSKVHPDPVYVAWRPVPNGQVNGQGLPRDVQLVTNAHGDVLVWRSADSAFAHMARQGFFAQRHPQATPVGVIEPAVGSFAASAIPVRLMLM